MNQRLLTLLAICLLSVVTPIVADDYVDDAYYWDGTTRYTTSIPTSQKVNVPASTKAKAATKEEKTTRVQTTNRPVTPTVEFLQVQDTVVKAVIHRNK